MSELYVALHGHNTVTTQSQCGHYAVTSFKVHFDEIGDLQDNVTELQETVRQVWELMLQ